MNIDKLLEDCASLEATAVLLVKANAQKFAKLENLQHLVFENSRTYLDALADKENKFQSELDQQRRKKQDIETRVAELTDINQKLSELVAITQKTGDQVDEQDSCKIIDKYYTVSDTISEYEQIKEEYSNNVDKLEQLNVTLSDDEEDVRRLVAENQQLNVALDKNDIMLRLASRQSKYAEQQFDLILSQIPWEPLSERYMDELRQSSDRFIQDMAENLKIQSDEIDELNQSLSVKKQKKFDVLKDLQSELNKFLIKRDEAILSAKLTV